MSVCEYINYIKYGHINVATLFASCALINTVIAYFNINEL